MDVAINACTIGFLCSSDLLEPFLLVLSPINTVPLLRWSFVPLGHMTLLSLDIRCQETDGNH